MATDDIGRFLIKGRYDCQSSESYWTKSYLVRTTSSTADFGRAKGIWGTWNWNSQPGVSRFVPKKAGESTACRFCGRCRAGRRHRDPNSEHMFDEPIRLYNQQFPILEKFQKWQLPNWKRLKMEIAKIKCPKMVIFQNRKPKNQKPPQCTCQHHWCNWQYIDVVQPCPMGRSYCNPLYMHAPWVDCILESIVHDGFMGRLYPRTHCLQP